MRRPLGLQDRILAWYGGTVLAVLGLILLLVQLRVSQQARDQVRAQMATARRVIDTAQRERTATLAMVARLAGKEPRLAAAMAGDLRTGQKVDPQTIGDILSLDLQKDFEADFMRVTDTHARVLWDTSGRTLPTADLSGEEDVRSALHGTVWPGMLILPAEIDLVATAPIHVGDQDLGTITLGRRVRDGMAAQLQSDTGSQVTFFAGRQLAASSWLAPVRPALLEALASTEDGGVTFGRSPARPHRFRMNLAGQSLMCLLVPTQGDNGTRGTLLIQGDLDAALRPYANIQRTLAGIGLLGLLFAIIGSIIIAGGITQPLQRIARAAHGLMQGDWSQRAPVTSRDEVGLLAETFNRMAERLESWDTDMRAAVAERTRELDAAYQKMRQFNADASHELRTPLTVIRGEAEVALRALRSGPEYQAILHTIQDETERMSRIVEQLLLLARVDSGELRLDRRAVSLDDLVREVTHRAEVLALTRKIHLRAEMLEPLVLLGDEDQLARLTLNLIDNAIKYTPEGGEVRVRLSSAPMPAGPPRDGEGEAILEVADTGIGIAAADLPRIFDRFYRVDKARSRSHGGSGLGLAICRWIVEAHGGRIDVRSQPGQGSTFTIRLPGARSLVTDVSPHNPEDEPYLPLSSEE